MSDRRVDSNFYRKQVKSDCEELLGRFQRTQSVRFEVFANIWREMEFAQIFWYVYNENSVKYLLYVNQESRVTCNK